MHAFRREADEVPEIIMRRLGLRKSAVRLLFDRVNQIRKLDRILNEENRDIITHDIPVSFLGIKLDREAANVSRKVGRTLAAGDGREPHKCRRALAGSLEEVGPSEFRE